MFDLHCIKAHGMEAQLHVFTIDVHRPTFCFFSIQIPQKIELLWHYLQHVISEVRSDV